MERFFFCSIKNSLERSYKNLIFRILSLLKKWVNHKPDSVLSLRESAYHLSGWAVARPF